MKMYQLLFTVLFLAINVIAIGQSNSDVECQRAQQIMEQAAELKRPKQRVKLMEKAVSLCPQADGPHFFYGLVLEEWQDRKPWGNYQQAEAEYRKALDINPDHYGALFKLAGLEYISGQFDNAKVHYERYLQLDSPNSENADTREAAEKLRAKCAWLSALPEGAIKEKALTGDRDRFAGVPTLIGEMAMHLGNSAMQATGQLGYGAAGTGLMLGMELLESSKDFGYNKIFKALDDEDHARAYDLARKKLPDAVNDHGINSDRVFYMLLFISSSGAFSGQPTASVVPFAEGLLRMDLPTGEVGVKAAAETNEWFWKRLVAYKVVGGFYQSQEANGKAAQWYSEGLQLINERGHFEEPERVRTNEIRLKMFKAEAELAIDSLHHSTSVQLVSLYEDINGLKDRQTAKSLSEKLVTTIDKWSMRAVSLVKPQESDVRSIAQLSMLQERLAEDEDNEQLLQLAGRALFRLFVHWGEYGQAFQSLADKGIANSEAGDYLSQATFEISRARLYNRAFMADSSDLYLSRLPEDFPHLVYYEKLHVARRLMLEGEEQLAAQLLEECQKLEGQYPSLKKQSLSAATALLWVLSEENETGTATLDTLDALWKEAANEHWPTFRAAGRNFLKAMVLPQSYDWKLKLLSDRFFAVAMAEQGCDSDCVDAFRQTYLMARERFDKALPLVRESSASLHEDTASYAYLLPRALATKAVLLHEAGHYAEAVSLRKELLARLLPFEDVLPENVADAQTRLGESMAAMGNHGEAVRELEQANLAFFGEWPEVVTARHKRAMEALKQARAGESDIGSHGRWALEYNR